VTNIVFSEEFQQRVDAKIDDLLNSEPFKVLVIDANQRSNLNRLFICSDFATEVCLKFPEYIAALLEGEGAKKEKQLEAYSNELAGLLSEQADFNEVGAELRKYRNKEMTRIVWRDAVLNIPVEETLRELSALADACIFEGMGLVYNKAVKEFGQPIDSAGNPVYPVVFAMGKLGAHELNFSSDIDLIFTYSEDGEIPRERKSLTHNEFFMRVCQNFMRLLSDNTAFGFVFRVDARLRPFGDSGRLTLSFDAMESYYEQHGREWERYAFIKARAISEDKVAAKEIADRLRPFVFRRYLDFSAFASLREMKVLIDKEQKRKGNENNVKLGPGGIREIEFIGQAFQLIRGGRDRRLQTRGILDVLKVLNEQNLMPDYVHEALESSYLFLRRAENAIQYFADKQTHLLPTQSLDQQRLAFALGFESWESFYTTLKNHTQTTHEHFEQIFSAPQLEAFNDKSGDNELTGVWSATLTEEEAIEVLEKAGFSDAKDALKRINQFRESNVCRAMGVNGRQRLDRLMPLLLSAIGQGSDPMLCLPRVIRLLDAIAKRTAYIALIAENPLGLSQLVKLFEISQWIVDLLVSYPMLLDELLDPRRLYEPMSKAELIEEIKYRVDLQDEDVETQMRALIEFKQTNMLRVAASELTGAMPVDKVSDHLTYIAEIVLESVSEMVSHHLQSRHGVPKYILDDKANEAGFCIIGYGKLGGMELGFGSDLDLVFLHDSQGSKQQTDGDKSVDNAVYFARKAQRIIHFLNTTTQGGVLYEVDTRLRPSGGSGLLVSGINSFLEYQRNQAWTWEHQALIRARPIYGSENLVQQFVNLRKEILTSQRDPKKLLQDVVEMRARMRKELLKASKDMFDIKQGFGGISDIEFLIQYLVLRHAPDHTRLADFTDNLRILENLAKHKLLPEDDAKMLAQAYLAYRHKTHELVLQGKKTIIPAEDNFTEFRSEVSRIWHDIMGDY